MTVSREKARQTISLLKGLHTRMSSEGLVISLAFPWAPGGEVVKVAANRSGDTLGLREFWLLGDLPESQRAALELFREGASVESIGVVAPEAPAPAPSAEPKRRRRAAK